MGSHVRISKYKNVFSKGYPPNCFEEIFLIKRVKNTVQWTYVIRSLNGEKVAGIIYKKKLRNANQIEFRIQKVIKKNEKAMIIQSIS